MYSQNGTKGSKRPANNSASSSDSDNPRSVESSHSLKRNTSESIQEFGIIRMANSTTDTNPNEETLPSISYTTMDSSTHRTTSDSELVGDISTASDIPDLSLQLNEFTSHVRGVLDDSSNLSEMENRKQEQHSSSSALAIPTFESEAGSLNEFEEIERLIAENTAVDTEDEQDNDDTERKSEMKVHQDTGYQSAGEYRAGRHSSISSSSPENCKISTARSKRESGDENTMMENQSSADHSRCVSNEDEDDDGTLQQAAPLRSRSSSVSHQGPAWSRNVPLTVSNSFHDGDTIVNRNLDVSVSPIPQSTDEQKLQQTGDDRLVATFGTTEKFEALLEQQLKNMEEEDDHHSSEEQEARRREEPMRRLQSTRTLSEQKFKEKKLQLRKDNRKKANYPNRTTRSPAANRVKRAQSSNARRRQQQSSLQRESSDELSVRSDVSRTELRQRLKTESRSRKKEEQAVKQLQNDYDDLLTKYAEAENTIDQLRIGAKVHLDAGRNTTNKKLLTSSSEIVDPQPQIKLFAELPSKNLGESGHILSNNSNRLPDGQGHLQDSFLHEQLSQINSPRGAGGAGTGRSENMDSLTENSLQLPSVASTEFLRVALQLQAKDLKKQIDSFQTLLDEGNLTIEEKKQGLRNIEDALQNLERDYIMAGKDHEAEKRRVAAANGGRANQNDEFDPQNMLEGEICRLGMMVEDLSDTVPSSTGLPQTPVPYPRSPHPSSMGSTLGKNNRYSSMTSESNSNSEIDDQFNDLVRRYNRSIQARDIEDDDDDKTTAPSIVMSTDFDSENDAGRYGQRKKTTSTANASSLPEKFFQPTSNSIVTPDTSPNNNKPTTKNSNTSPPSEERYGRPRSRLPRPVEKSLSPGTKTESRTHDGEADSGFMGSESSRQSVSTAAPIENRSNVILPPTATVRKVTPQLKKPLMQDSKLKQRKQNKTTAKPSSSAPPTPPVRSDLRKAPSPNHSPKVDAVTVLQLRNQSSQGADDSGDDISTSSTVREMLNHAYVPRPGLSGCPIVSGHYKPDREYVRSKSAGSQKSRSSSKRSAGSSSKDSTLDLLRGEIDKLRNEIQATKRQEKENQEPMNKRAAINKKSKQTKPDSETLKAIRNDIKELKHQFLKQSQGTGDEVTDGFATQPKGARDDSRTAHRRRSSSLGRLSGAENRHIRSDSPPTSRQRSPYTDGYWTYVSPIPAVRYSYPIITPPSTEHIVYGTQENRIHVPALNTLYRTSPELSPARVYVPVISPETIGTPTVKIPQKNAKWSSSFHSRKLRKASLYVVEDSDDEDGVPLSRSQLSPIRRSSSMSRLYPNDLRSSIEISSRLNSSLDRAERASDVIRSQTRTMYRSIRNSLYESEVIADRF